MFQEIDLSLFLRGFFIFSFLLKQESVLVIFIYSIIPGSTEMKSCGVKFLQVYLWKFLDFLLYKFLISFYNKITFLPIP